MAAAALAVLNPLDTLASFGANPGLRQVTLLHTPLPSLEITSGIKKLKYNPRNPVFIYSGNKTAETNPRFDVAAGNLSDEFEGKYRLLKKGSFTIGVIETNNEDWNTAEKMNNIAAFLKKEKGCDLVICLSDLGFSNRSMLDDTRLAAKSENLDVIIGKKTAASPPLPYIAINKNRAEVILSYSGDREMAMGNIKIVFDAAGNKCGVEFDQPLHPRANATA